MKKPVFLISTGRTGTKYFANFFQSFGINVASYHTSSFTRFLNILSNMYYKELLSKKVMGAIWRRLKYEKIQSHNYRYIECNPYYYNLIDIISSFFPEAKFIFIIRAPKSFIISHIKWEKQRWQSMFANRAIPFWQPVSYWDQIRGFGNKYHQRVEFYSKIWVRKNTMIWESIVNKDNAITVKFEEVFDPVTGVDVITKIVEWLNISLDRQIDREMIIKKINKTKKAQNIWDKDCERIMNKYCRSLMEYFGYK